MAKFLLRIPESMHAKLKQEAKAEGVSMNHLAVMLLSQSFGVRKERAKKKRAVKCDSGSK